ncbi:MAG: FAD-dependent monooxygenase [Pseudomonadota bacterium]
MKVLIAGAGIAGLAQAALLLKRGHSVRIFERSARLTEVGAGIQISANAGHVLDEMGLTRAVNACSYRPQVWHMRTYLTGEVVNRIELGEHHERLHGCPYRTLLRADLQRLLVGCVQSQDPDAIVLGADVSGYAESASNASLQLAGGERLEGDVVIAADGVQSVLRRQIVGPDKPIYSGNAAWRGTIDARKLPADFSDGITTSFMGPGRHMTMYWLGKRELLNFVAPVETAIPSEESWTTKEDWAMLKSDFEGWHKDLQTVIDQTDRDACYRWALNIREPATNWHTRRAVLIGDAAHATLPFLAQGAAMALEDAAVLDRLLAQDTDVPSALARFQAARRERTTRIVQGANKMSRMFHLESEPALKEGMAKGADVARDRDNWLYNYNPITVPLQ